MADENSRYNVAITLTVTDATTGEPTAFSRTVQEYSDMPYEYMQAVQAVGIPALVQALLAPGNALAEEIKAKRKAKSAAPVVRPEEQFKR
jgi:hypothetical protein